MKRKLRKLFESLNKVSPQHVEKTIYNFAFGALHALCKSSEVGYPEHARLKVMDEEGKVYKTVRLLTQQAERGILPTDRWWLAGFFSMTL